MSLELTDFEFIDAYLRDELSQDEISRFHELCNSNLEFAKEFELKKSVQNALKINGNIELKSLLQNKEAKSPQLQKPKTIGVKRWLSYAAGILILAGFLSFFFQSNPTNDLTTLYLENFSPYPNDYIRIERGEHKASALREIFIDYERKEYNKVIHGIDTQLKDSNDIDLKLVFFKAICKMAIGEQEEASHLLYSLKQSKLENYENQINWYTALNSLELNNLEKAKTHLKSIVSAEDEFRKTSAIALLKKLEN